MGFKISDLENKFRYSQVFTPKTVAELLVQYSDLSHSNLIILEPSIGEGHLAKIIQKNMTSTSHLMGIDIDELLVRKVKEKGYIAFQQDFLKVQGFKFDRIIASPPFNSTFEIKGVYQTNQVDYLHIRHMYKLLNKYGRLVSTVHKRIKYANDLDTRMFRKFLKRTKAEVYDLNSGSFKEFGSNVEACFMVINK